MRQISRIAPALVALLLPAPRVIAGELFGSLRVGDRPAAGIAVEARPLAGPAERARDEARGTPPAPPLAAAVSDAAGRFRVALPDGTAGVALTLSGPGVVPLMVSAIPLPGEPTDLGEIALLGGRPLAGRVVDPDGAPLGGALVELTADAPDGEPWPQRALTAADGSFRFDGAARRGNRLRVEARGYALRSLPGVESGAIAAPVRMAAGHALAGAVARRDGGAAAGALVRFEGRAAESRWVETDDGGRFWLEDLPEGEGRLVVDAGETGVAAVPASLPADPALPLRVTLQAPARIEGRIVNARGGEALAGVVLLARRRGGDARLASDAAGRYALGGLLPGDVTLEVQDRRYASQSRDVEALAAGETRRVDLILTPAASISGRVVDEVGAPVAGARGRLVDVSGGGPGRLFRPGRFGRGGRAFVTGADGRFRADRLTPGEGLQLVVRHPDHAPAQIGGIDLPPGGAVNGLEIVLPRGLALEGFVRDGAGLPIPGATLRVLPAPGGGPGRGGPGPGGFALGLLRGGGPREEESDAEGRFRFDGLEAGRYLVMAEREGFAPAEAGPLTLDQESPPVEIAMSPGASITGWLLRPDGSPVEGVTVIARAGFGRGMLRRGGGGENRASGADGSFRIDGLEPGVEYELLAGGRGPGGEPLERVEAPASGVEIQMPGIGGIEGRVRDAEDGHPLADFSLRAIPEDGRGGRRAALVAELGLAGDGEEVAGAPDGAFVVDEVPEGSWTLQVDAPGYQPARLSGIEVAAGQRVTGVEVRVRRGQRLEGRVLDASSRRPIPGAAIALEPASGGRRIGGRGGATADADGEFAIAGLAPGAWNVTASHPDYTDGVERVELGDTTARVELSLRAGASVSGVVLSPGQVPLSGVDVTLSPAGSGGRFGAGGDRTLSDGTGGFRFRHLSAGRFDVVARARDGQAASTQVTLQDGEAREGVVLALEGGATLRVAVSGLADAERAGVFVSARGPDGFWGNGVTDAEGRADVPGAPPGPVDVSASVRGASVRSATAQVQVEAGQLDVPVELRFGQGFVLSGRVTRAGDPVAGVRVAAWPEGGGRGAGIGAATTDDDGGYAVRDLAADLYQVSVEEAARQVRVEADTRFDVELPTARLQGVVLDALGGTPIADARIDARVRGAAPDAPGHGARSDSEGRFEVSPVEPGEWTLSVTHPSYQASVVEATAAELPRAVTVELRRGDGLALRIVDGLLGLPLRGARVRARDASGLALFDGPVALDDEGRGVVPSLPPGLYRLRVWASGYAPIELSATVPAAALELGLTPGGALELHAGSRTAAALPAVLRLLGPSGAPQPIGGADDTGALTLRTPALRLEHVAPGRYSLVVDGVGAADVEVREGVLARVELP